MKDTPFNLSVEAEEQPFVKDGMLMLGEDLPLWPIGSLLVNEEHVPYATEQVYGETIGIKKNKDGNLITIHLLDLAKIIACAKGKREFPQGGTIKEGGKGYTLSPDHEQGGEIGYY